MKNLATISLFIFGVAMAAILTAGLVFYQNNKINNSGLNISGSNNSIGQLPGQTGNAKLILTAIEVAKHNSISDCWMIINNKVYNVTSYLFAHPGGAGVMVPYCGQEATRAFQTKDKNSSHSSYADSLLADYYLGDLNQAVSQQQIQKNTNSTNQIPPPARGGDEDGRDEEDD